MKLNTRLAAAACFLAVLAAHATPAPAPELRELNDADVAQWRVIEGALLSPDGRWLAYVDAAWPGTAAKKGDVSIVLRAVDADTQRRYPAGKADAGAGQLKMSPSGRWIAFEKTAPEVAAVLVQADSGAQRELKGVQRLEFIAGDEILLQRGNDLAIETLNGTVHRTLQGVTEFALNPSATHLVWIGPHGVGEYNFLTGTERSLAPGSDQEYSNLTWSKRGNAVAMLRNGGDTRALLAFTGLNGAHTARHEFAPAKWQDFPPGASLATSLQWRDDEKGLFFAIQPPRSPPSRSDKSNLRIWHYRDDYVPGERQARDAAPATDWCFVDLSKRRFIRLSDPALQNVELQAAGRYVLGYDLNPYGSRNKGWMRTASTASQLRDYYQVDLQSGERRILLRGLNTQGRPSVAILPQLSPQGAVLMYENPAGDVLARDLTSGGTRNLTQSLPTKFYFPENDPKTGWALRDSFGQGDPRVQGWTSDARYVLVSDHYDIWALPLKVGEAINLTGNGRRENIWYRRFVMTEPGSAFLGSASPVNLSKPLYFYAFDLKTGRTGLARHMPGESGAQLLHSEFSDIMYMKAERADTFLYTRTSTAESLDYYRVGKDWKPDRRLTDINPEQREIRLASGARYLTYKNTRGEERHAALLLPADYVAGKSYPTIVEIYKGFSGGVHAYREPTSYMQMYLRRGYAFLQPDIVPRLNDPGRAALEDVTAGVEAAVASGVVDRDKVGLTGHSYGAYEANFIITQTNLFKAAVAHSGMTNLWSDALKVYQDRWPQEYSDQPYLSGPWWENWDAILKNSPLYHARNINTPLLLASGDRDGAVSIAQSLELFNTLRQLAKPVVLLEYKGAEHDLYDPADAHDFERRRAEFFDHFLRGAPAPAWWQEGISRYEGQVPAN